MDQSENKDVNRNEEDNMTRREAMGEMAKIGALAATPAIVGLALEMRQLSQNSMHDDKKEKMLNMTAEDIEKELREGNRVEWVRAGDIKKMCCVDGRCQECVAGVAGGEAGMLVAAFSSMEDSVEKNEVVSVVNDLEDGYMHTDSHGLAYVREELGMEINLSDEEMEDALREMANDPDNLDRIRDVMSRPEAQGCGHLKNMMLDPESYNTTKEIVTLVVKAIVNRWLRQLPSAKLGKHATVHCLKGEHGERALVQVNFVGEITEDTLVPLIKPNEGEGKKEFFLYMPQIADFRMKHIVALIEEKTGKKVSLEKAQKLSADQTLVTAKRLAHGKPLIAVQCVLKSQEFSAEDKGLVPEYKAAA